MTSQLELFPELERPELPRAEVQLIDYTGAGAADPARHAANLLVFTKQTRLEMKPGLLEDIAAWPEDRILAELAYMANTIPSSWEFVEYKFLINNVTRGFTHQFVRTRTASYAQQTMRVLNVGGWTYGTGPTVADNDERKAEYADCMKRIASTYDDLIAMGAKIEDARGVLPTNIHTNIVAKFDLRIMADTARKRASGRTQGEYREVMDLMKAEVMRVHPWARLFFERTFDLAASDLEAKVRAIDGLSEEQKTNMVKLIDQMRMTA
jgi:flavin-dependent thymidylate synthase